MNPHHDTSQYVSASYGTDESDANLASTAVVDANMPGWYDPPTPWIASQANQGAAPRSYDTLTGFDTHALLAQNAFASAIGGVGPSYLRQAYVGPADTAYLQGSLDGSAHPSFGEPRAAAEAMIEHSLIGNMSRESVDTRTWQYGYFTALQEDHVTLDQAPCTSVDSANSAPMATAPKSRVYRNILPAPSFISEATAPSRAFRPRTFADLPPGRRRARSKLPEAHFQLNDAGILMPIDGDIVLLETPARDEPEALDLARGAKRLRTSQPFDTSFDISNVTAVDVAEISTTAGQMPTSVQSSCLESGGDRPHLTSYPSAYERQVVAYDASELASAGESYRQDDCRDGRATSEL